MSKKLEELFDLSTPTDYLNRSEDATLTETIPDLSPIPQDALSTLEKIEAAMPAIRDMSAEDADLDQYAEMAKDKAEALADLGFQVDSRFAAEIFAVSGAMLGHAITAKTAKINKKLKQLDLMLKKAALDQKQQQIDAKEAEKSQELEATPLGSGSAMDRNELLRTLLADSKKE